MRTIGIRAEPAAITFVVYDSKASAIINAEQMKLPDALTLPEKLKYLRINLLDILREYNIEQAGIRITESISQNFNISRIQNEAVITEAFASGFLKKYFCGGIATITKLAELESGNFKKYIDGQLDYPNVENWASFKKEEKEACLAAIGAVNA